MRLVVACAAILPLTGLSTRLLRALDDSRRLSPKVREEIAVKLRLKAIWPLGEAGVDEIDSFNILRATYMAARPARRQTVNTRPYASESLSNPSVRSAIVPLILLGSCVTRPCCCSLSSGVLYADDQ